MSACSRQHLRQRPVTANVQRALLYLCIKHAATVVPVHIEQAAASAARKVLTYQYKACIGISEPSDRASLKWFYILKLAVG